VPLSLTFPQQLLQPSGVLRARAPLHLLLFSNAERLPLLLALPLAWVGLMLAVGRGDHGAECGQHRHQNVVHVQRVLLVLLVLLVLQD
jgi:hypothetical protein